MADHCLRSLSLLLLVLLLALLLPPLEVLSQDFDLSDALDDSKAPTPPPHPAGGPGGEGDQEDLSKISGTTTTTKVPPKVIPKAPTGTKAPVKPKPKPVADDFDLSDALDPNNDISDKERNKGQGGGFSDDDLLDISKDPNYKPDKGKGGLPSGDKDQINQYDDNTETTAEVGTIAGIVSAVAMALVGAISSYISYQKKKLCFSIQQSLNTDMVKAENPEVVVAAEPPVQQSLLEPSSAEPPTEENAV